MNHEELYFLLAKKNNRATAENHVCVVQFAEEKKGVKTTSWLVYVFHWVDFPMKQY